MQADDTYTKYRQLNPLNVACLAPSMSNISLAAPSSLSKLSVTDAIVDMNILT